MSAAQLPVDHWIGQIRKCATEVTGTDGPEPQFRASGELPVGAEIVGVIESLLDACNGRLSDAGGVYKLFAGAVDVPVMSLTDDEVMSTSGQSFTPFFGLSDTVNGISGKYPSPAAGWQTETAPPLYRPDYEAQDGGRRLLVDVSLDFVPYAEQVQRLMKSALNEARRARRHTLHLPPKYWPLEPGDVVTWTSARNGYVEKQFRVDGMIDLADGDVVVDLTEVDPADYDFNTATDFEAPAIPGSSVQPITVQDVGDFDVFASSIPDSTGVGRRPAIRAVWTGDIPDVRAVKFETRVEATGRDLPPSLIETVGAGEIYISDGVLPLTEYEVRAKFIPEAQQPTAWTGWKTVTTSDIRFGAADIDTSITDAIADAQAEIAEMAGIKALPTLPATGEKPDQIVMLPDGVL
ncbi:phage tail protein, partial [Pseudorhodobacter sp.]|uniref:phage tail protein n=1 Tax=Pseudorhodobacter sp. TaxID=1934400 RepID=UPI0026477417